MKGNDSLANEIASLKIKKNAVILAHYYVEEEVQKIADYVGDSYYLSQKAVETKAQIIVFAGVRFMGESAKLLNPDKKVLMPDEQADCAMAHMITVAEIEKMREKYDDLAVVCYINSTAEIKQHSDICVTSSNAVQIVRNMKEKNLFFIPDRNLGSYVAARVPDKNVILNEGYCPVHEKITVSMIQHKKNRLPEALLIAHPECRKEVLELADFVGSTSELIEFVGRNPAKQFLVATETGVFYQMQKQNPDKLFYSVREDQICHDMKRITRKKILEVLENETNEILLDPSFIEGAVKPLERMLGRF